MTALHAAGVGPHQQLHRHGRPIDGALGLTCLGLVARNVEHGQLLRTGGF